MTDGDNVFGLYFQLKPGRKADLEVVAEAAMLWVQTLRAAARAIDPNTQIRVEIIDAKESSLQLNTIFDWLESHLARLDAGSAKYPRLRSVAIALAVFLVTQGPQTVDFYFGDKETISADERKLFEGFLEILRGDPEVEQNSK